MDRLRQAIRRWIGESRLRRRLRRELASLDINEPTTMATVCQRLGRRRGKPIKLIPYSFDVPGPFGMWLPTASADYILYHAETTALHQQHIIAHELGHLLAGHGSFDEGDLVFHELMPDIPPETIRRALQRSSYDTDEEREAETVATILLESAAVVESVTRPARSARARRAQQALGDQRSWP